MRLRGRQLASIDGGKDSQGPAGTRDFTQIAAMRRSSRPGVVTSLRCCSEKRCESRQVLSLPKASNNRKHPGQSSESRGVGQALQRKPPGRVSRNWDSFWELPTCRSHRTKLAARPETINNAGPLGRDQTTGGAVHWTEIKSASGRWVVGIRVACGR